MKLKSSYLNPPKNIFSEVTTIAHNYASKVNALPIVKLGVGDVVYPISNIVANAMAQACVTMAHSETFHGYGDECGELFYRQAISQFYASKYNVNLSTNEIFASDGAIGTLVSLLELFEKPLTLALPNPCYPVYHHCCYLDNIDCVTMPLTEENGFLPQLPNCHVDAIYLCSPANPTGITYPKWLLQQFVDYCLANDSLLIFDSAYLSFADEGEVATIFSIEGAKKIAVEIGSLSKSAGFTGLRCGYTLIAKENQLNKMWKARCLAKSNGVSYISQVGGRVALSSESQLYTASCVSRYKANLTKLTTALTNVGLTVYGKAPYLWVTEKSSSMTLFNKLLDNCGLLTLPGVGLGSYGEGYIRVSGFCTTSDMLTAVDRLKSITAF